MKKFLVVLSLAGYCGIMAAPAIAHGDDKDKGGKKAKHSCCSKGSKSCSTADKKACGDKGSSTKSDKAS